MKSGPVQLIGVVAVLAIFSPSSMVASSRNKIVIGGSLSLSGSFAPLGQTQHRGLKLCIKNVNEKGGVLGREVNLIVKDDRSQSTTAVDIYRHLILEENIDAVVGPYSSGITDAVADLTEKHRMPMVASGSASSAIFRKGRRFVFMVLSPTDIYFEGLIDLAAKRGLKSIAFIHQDTLFPRSAVEGGRELAEKEGLDVVLTEAYPRGLADFSSVLEKVRAASPDVLAAGTYFEDVVAITRQLKASNINPKMFGATVGVHLPKFYKTLRQDAEFVYGATQWEPELVKMRAGGLIPIAREYPGAKQFVAAYEKEYPGVPFSHLSASAYAGCQILVEAIRRAGSLDGQVIRDVISGMNINTVYGAFRVDRRGIQVAHKMMWFQWQDGKKVIVWPTEITPRKPRFPTPEWTRR